MSDRAGIFLVALLQIDDREAYRQYEAGFMPVLSQYNGRLIGGVDGPEVLEGEQQDGRLVLLRFDDRESADAWYHSPEYQALAAIRQSASTARFLAVVPEFDFGR